MSYTCLEATSAEQLANYKNTADYTGFVRGALDITEGVNPTGDIDENENEVPLHWVLIEKADDMDNATFRVNADGIAVYWASGVEI